MVHDINMRNVATSRYVSRSPPYVRTKPGVGLLRNDDDLTAAAGWENEHLHKLKIVK